MSRDYWLGVITLPTLAAVLLALFVAWVWLTAALEERGIFFEAKFRSTDSIPDYTLRSTIWWERSFGPVFIGGWYRDAAFTRWIGLGWASGPGPCVIGYWKRNH